MEWTTFWNTLLPLLSSLLTLIITTGSQMLKDRASAKKSMRELEMQQRLEIKMMEEKHISENLTLHRQECQELRTERKDLYYKIIASSTNKGYDLDHRCAEIYLNAVKLLSLCDPSKQLYVYVDDLINYFHSSDYVWGRADLNNMDTIRQLIHSIGTCMYNQNAKVVISEPDKDLCNENSNVGEFRECKTFISV